MFGLLLIMSVVIGTAVNYGIAKDSQTAPLKAKNTYAGIKTGQAQTGLTIVNTCLNGQGDYTAWNGNGPYTLWLTVKNNGSTVLNPNNATVFFNLTYSNFSVTTNVSNSTPFGNVWSPLKNITISVPNIYIYNINYPNGLIPYRLMMAASNGITAIAPTTPVNFGGTVIKSNTTYSFWWNASYDAAGIAYYLLNGFDNKPDGSCPSPVSYFITIPGNYTSTAMDYQVMCNPSCNTDYFYLTAVDNDGNMGVQSYTLKCIPANNANCG